MKPQKCYALVITERNRWIHKHDSGNSREFATHVWKHQKHVTPLGAKQSSGRKENSSVVWSKFLVQILALTLPWMRCIIIIRSFVLYICRIKHNKVDAHTSFSVGRILILMPHCEIYSWTGVWHLHCIHTSSSVFLSVFRAHNHDLRRWWAKYVKIDRRWQIRFRSIISQSCGVPLLPSTRAPLTTRICRQGIERNWSWMKPFSQCPANTHCTFTGRLHYASSGTKMTP